VVTLRYKIKNYQQGHKKGEKKEAIELLRLILNHSTRLGTKSKRREKWIKDSHSTWAFRNTPSSHADQ